MTETSFQGVYVPFKKTGKNRYKSPSGRSFTKKQVAMYYATDGFKNAGRKRQKAKS